MLSLVLASVALAGKAAKIPALAEVKEITWVGIDYTRASFYWQETFDEKGRQYHWAGGGGYGFYYSAPENRSFDTPTDAYDAFTRAWNELYVTDVLDTLKDSTGKKIKVALADPKFGPTKPGRGDAFKGLTGSSKDADITADIVAEMVKGYPAGTGLAMAFIADRSSKADEEACFWPTVYDASTHAVVWTKRMCGKTSGLGLRNYYFTPAKHVTEELEDVRKSEW